MTGPLSQFGATPAPPGHAPATFGGEPLTSLPAGGAGVSLLRAAGTLGVVRGWALGELLNDPLDGATKLLLGMVARCLGGRGMTRLTGALGVRGGWQRALIFAGESVLEGSFYDWYERSVKRRKPRRAAGYLRPDRDALVRALVGAGLSAAGLTWAGRESDAHEITLPAGSVALSYGTRAKLERIAKEGLRKGSFLTPNVELKQARVCEILALPGAADVVAKITFHFPIAARVRPIAADFGRLGGGIEIVTESAVPAWALSVGPGIPLGEASTT